MKKLPPLYAAIVADDVDRVKKLLTKKWYRSAADINGFDTDCGFTPLHRAIECRNGKILRLLLSQRPAPEVNMCFAGVTPLDLAIQSHYKEGMQRLRGMGAKTARDLREENSSQTSVASEESPAQEQNAPGWSLAT